MEMNIRNFGPVKNAEININQINVIGGVNGSGKSFTARLLFCFLTSLSEKGKRIENKGLYIRFKDFITSRVNKTYLPYLKSECDNKKLNALMRSWDEKNISYDYLIGFYNEFEKILNENELLNDTNCITEFEHIKNIIESNRDEYGYVERVISYLMEVEFGLSEFGYFKGSEITFKRDNLFKLDIAFKKNYLESDFKHYKSFKGINVFYIDCGSLVDFNASTSYHSTCF